jgi:hypothetical protein
LARVIHTEMDAIGSHSITTAFEIDSEDVTTSAVSKRRPDRFSWNSFGKLIGGLTRKINESFTRRQVMLFPSGDTTQLVQHFREDTNRASKGLLPLAFCQVVLLTNPARNAMRVIQLMSD